MTAAAAASLIDHTPDASVVIPAYNEERAISSCLDSVLAQTHDRIEVLVVDGGSTDRTREIVEDYAKVDPRVRLVDNPRRIPPAALNVAVGEMRSEWLVRIDAHATVPPDYVDRVLTHLRTGEWGGVGGRKDGVGFTDEGRAIAAVMASPFGVGNSTYHHGAELTAVDHIPFGAYPRDVIVAVGGWDESVPVNQDYEFDYRVRQAGHQLLFDPELRIAWECRQSLRAFWRQYRRYGRGKAQVVRMHPESIAVRHMAAPALVAMLAAAMAVLPFRPRWALALVAPYAAVVAAGTATTVPKVAAGSARRSVPAAFLAMHVAWGVGFWEGVAGAVAKRRDESV
ncbi:MAG TPA: glycosyltransferase family 2 protein [Microthrixaceae bacterium]|nr:glycosyltransferase family 2 protein [Microthrixaceae bacterium]